MKNSSSPKHLLSHQLKIPDEEDYSPDADIDTHSRSSVSSAAQRSLILHQELDQFDNQLSSNRYQVTTKDVLSPSLPNQSLSYRYQVTTKDVLSPPFLGESMPITSEQTMFTYS